MLGQVVKLGTVFVHLHVLVIIMCTREISSTTVVYEGHKKWEATFLITLFSSMPQEIFDDMSCS